MTTKMDEGGGWGEVSQEQIGNEDLFLIDLPQPTKPLNHVITGRTPGRHHGAHVSLFLLLTCIIRANQAPEAHHTIPGKSLGAALELSLNFHSGFGPLNRGG